MLVAWFVVSIGVAKYRSARAVRDSAVVRRLMEPIRVRPGAKVGPKRDIYLIVLDEYANAEVTGRLFGFDNHVFLDSLRQLGFVVPAVHSNYCHTFLSVPSMLNASHIVGLSGELGRRSVDRTVTDYLVTHNRTVPFLKSQGYQLTPCSPHSGGRQPGTTHGRTWSSIRGTDGTPRGKWLVRVSEVSWSRPRC